MAPGLGVEGRRGSLSTFLSEASLPYNPRTPNVHISGPRCFQQNSTKRRRREKRKEEHGGGKGKKDPTFWASTLQGIHNPSGHPPPFQASTLRGIQLSHHPFLGLAPSPHRTSLQFGPQPEQVKRAGLKGGGGGGGEGGSNGGTKGRVGGGGGLRRVFEGEVPFFVVCVLFFFVFCVSRKQHRCMDICAQQIRLSLLIPQWFLMNKLTTQKNLCCWSPLLQDSLQNHPLVRCYFFGVQKTLLRYKKEKC